MAKNTPHTALQEWHAGWVITHPDGAVAHGYAEIGAHNIQGALDLLLKTAHVQLDQITFIGEKETMMGMVGDEDDLENDDLDDGEPDTDTIENN
jgi:hypothetical protein